MARTIKVLTALEVKAIKEPGMHRVDDGLYLQVASKTARSWIHRFTLDGKATWSGLGPADAMSLADARAARDDERALIRQGINPVTQRKALRTAAEPVKSKKTFREVAADYIANHESSWKNHVHRKQWTSTLDTYVHPIIGDMPVDEITTDHIRQVLQPIWYTKPETARRVRGRIEKILGFAKPLGLRSGENPARLADNIEHVFPKREKRKVKHHPALPYAQIPAFMTELREHEGIAALCQNSACRETSGDA